MNLPHEALALFEDQHHVARRAQLHAAGVDRHSILRLVKAGALHPIGRHVVRLAGTRLTDRVEASAAVLDAGPGAALSGTSAAALWGIPGFVLAPHHVATTAILARSRSTLGEVHHTTLLEDDHVAVLDGIRVMRPARLLFDLASELGESRLARTVDAAWSRRLTNGAILHAMLREARRSGRPGVRRFEAVLDDRPESWRPPESGLESRFLQLVREHALGDFRLQEDLCDELGWIGRVDFVEERDRLVVEIQSKLHHASPTDRRRDRDRRERLEAAGYRVVEVWDDELFAAPGAIVERIRAARLQSPRSSAKAIAPASGITDSAVASAPPAPLLHVGSG